MYTVNGPKRAQGSARVFARHAVDLAGRKARAIQQNLQAQITGPLMQRSCLRARGKSQKKKQRGEGTHAPKQSNPRAFARLNDGTVGLRLLYLEPGVGLFAVSHVASATVPAYGLGIRGSLIEIPSRRVFPYHLEPALGAFGETHGIGSVFRLP